MVQRFPRGNWAIPVQASMLDILRYVPRCLKGMEERFTRRTMPLS